MFTFAAVKLRPPLSERWLFFITYISDLLIVFLPTQQ